MLSALLLTLLRVLGAAVAVAVDPVLGSFKDRGPRFLYVLKMPIYGVNAPIMKRR